ncbi:MAG: metal ABC transporter permease [Clostridiales bacterium]|nr:metal ABC transporter permease [Clostridiales bacterium]
MSAIQKLIEYFSYPFVRYAMIVGVLVALCAAVLGVSLVLKRFSMIGDGLSHVAFGAMAIGTVISVNSDLVVTLPVTACAAVFILRSKKLRGDAAIAILSVSALSLGYLLLHVFSPSANISGDVCTSLFGSTSILTLNQRDVYLCIVLSALVLCLFVVFYHRIFAITFDENFAKATGMHTEIYNLAIAIVTAIVIVLAMRLVGALLISALIIFPALSAMALFKSFRAVMIFAAVMSVICAAAGILISILCGTPVGSTIVAADLSAFVLCKLAGGVCRR